MERMQEAASAAKAFISVVSPVYMAEKLVGKLVEKVSEQIAMVTDDFEIILVEDGSPDLSWQSIEAACAKNKKVKGIKLSRNFGQHYAITAGLDHASGEWVVVMDCDLQDRPEEIPRLFQKAQEGFELVFARRSVRQDSFFKKSSSQLFYRLFSFMTETPQDHSIANFGIYHQKVIQAILSMGDHIRYFPTMSQWVGFRKAYLEVEHGAREEGKTTYTWRKLLRLAWDNIIAFSDRPLRLAVSFGILISSIAVLIGFYYLIQYLRGEIIVLGYASLIISLWFLSGAIIFVVGITGIYIGKTFEKVKNRPIYIVSKKKNLN